MSLSIVSPAEGASLPLADPVVFTGTSTGGITKVVATADAEFDLGEVGVAGDGSWRLTRQFCTAADRRITVTGYDNAGNAIETDGIDITLTASPDYCANRVVLFTIIDGDTGAAKRVYTLAGDPTIFYSSGMTICVDGSPRAYCVNNAGLDTLANATENGEVTGPLSPDIVVFDPVTNRPIVQANNCYVSQTALQDAAKATADPLRYVNAETIPYIVLPGIPNVARDNLAPGDFAAVYNKSTGQVCFAIYGDVGPADHLGEGSLYLARQLGIPDVDPRTGGAESGIFYVVFPGSRQTPVWAAATTTQDIENVASPLFESWGGRSQLDSCVADLG